MRDKAGPRGANSIRIQLFFLNEILKEIHFETENEHIKI